jgi:hypothetical protein
VGWRAWKRISASPVWLPPDGTPPKDLLKKRRKPKPDEPPYEVNMHEIGPSYASAYGLVAAYHQKYLEKSDGTIRLGGDEGIRTHGSVDYMSIMRRHSHGCHRLHNHIAVRLMSFVLAHRPHSRRGQRPLSFKKTLVHEEQEYEIDLKQGGYIFELERPVLVNVLEGNIKGKQKTPIEVPVPKYDEDAGAYVMPDAGAVVVRDGGLVQVPMPEGPDGGVDGGEAGVGEPEPPEEPGEPGKPEPPAKTGSAKAAKPAPAEKPATPGAGKPAAPGTSESPDTRKPAAPGAERPAAPVPQPDPEIPRKPAADSV